VLGFVDASRHKHPIKHLSVALTVTMKSGTVATKTEVTDASGRIRIVRVGPLPRLWYRRAVYISGRKQRTRVATCRSATGRLLIQRGTGAKVAEARAVSAPYQVASLGPMVQRSRFASSRTVVYETYKEIPLKRNFVDFEIDIPPDAQVFVPSGNVGDHSLTDEREWTPVDLKRDGTKTRFTLPASVLGGGADL